MSSRPQGFLVFGIDDNENDFNEELLENRINLCDRKEDSAIYDFFYNYNIGAPYFAHEKLYKSDDEKIIGLIVDKTQYGSQFIRCLTLFYPEFNHYLKIDIPVLDRSLENSLYVKRFESQLKLMRRKVNWNWFYPESIEIQTMWPIYADFTEYLFQQINMPIDRNRLKAMFISEWV